jgi:hypothetical protein
LLRPHYYSLQYTLFPDFNSSSTRRFTPLPTPHPHPHPTLILNRLPKLYSCLLDHDHAPVIMVSSSKPLNDLRNTNPNIFPTIVHLPSAPVKEVRRWLTSTQRYLPIKDQTPYETRQALPQWDWNGQMILDAFTPDAKFLETKFQDCGLSPTMAEFLAREVCQDIVEAKRVQLFHIFLEPFMLTFIRNNRKNASLGCVVMSLIRIRRQGIQRAGNQRRNMRGQACVQRTSLDHICRYYPIMSFRLESTEQCPGCSEWVWNSISLNAMLPRNTSSLSDCERFCSPSHLPSKQYAHTHTQRDATVF